MKVIKISENIIDFKGIKILESEAELIKELNSAVNIDIGPIIIDFYDYPLQERIFFTTHENHVVGLDLEKCKLVQIPEIISEFKFLRILSLAYNKLKKLPENISKLKNLKSLNLKRNELREIPQSILELRNLEHLDISQNLITKLPPSLFELNSLKSLSVAYNRIEDVPDIISNLEVLEYLDLGGNDLKSLPPSLLKINTLKMLTLSSTTFDNKTKELLNRVKKEFKEYVSNNIPRKDRKYIKWYINKVPKLYILTPPYKIGFFYEWGGQMFWSRNDNASLKFGSPIDPFNLPISPENAQKFKDLNCLWEELVANDDSHNTEWERLTRETGELLENTAKELGPAFKFCEDFDSYIEARKKRQELDGEISKPRLKALLDEALSNWDESLILDIINKGFFDTFPKTVILDYIDKLILNEFYNLADLLISKYLEIFNETNFISSYYKETLSIEDTQSRNKIRDFFIILIKNDIYEAYTFLDKRIGRKEVLRSIVKKLLKEGYEKHDSKWIALLKLLSHYRQQHLKKFFRRKNREYGILSYPFYYNVIENLNFEISNYQNKLIGQLWAISKTIHDNTTLNDSEISLLKKEKDKIAEKLNNIFRNYKINDQ